MDFHIMYGTSRSFLQQIASSLSLRVSVADARENDLRPRQVLASRHGKRLLSHSVFIRFPNSENWICITPSASVPSREKQTLTEEATFEAQ